MRIADFLSNEFLNNLSGNFPARLDIELILMFILSKPRSFLYAHSEHELSLVQEKEFNVLLERRIRGEPLAYIVEKKEFWSYEFKVDHRVLVPRPETEVLVAVALDKITCRKATVADLGTGSGVIAITLAAMHPEWEIIATDISNAALEVARFNALQKNLKNIKFCLGDWCQTLPRERKFDAVISNPPYLAEDDPHLLGDGVMFEPKIALAAGNGMLAFEQIARQAKKRLKNKGLLILEHGYNQNKKLQNLLKINGYKNISSVQDLAGIDRIVVAEK